MSTSNHSEGSLRHKTSRGTVWMTGQVVYVKLLGLALQLVLAKLLLREDFGLYGLALTVYTFAAMFHQAGVLEVLIQRQRTFHIWSEVGFWLSFACGMIAFLMTILIAPLVARFYEYPEPETLVRLIRVMACVFPLVALGAVNRAKLQIEMRFRELALIGAVTATADVTLKVLFAYLGYGAFSFAYGALISQVVYLALCWYFAPVRVRWRPQLRRWKYLLNDGMMVVGALVCTWVIEEGDYVVLGRFEDVGVVGLYFFAFRISRHIVSLMTWQVSKVLFPALSSLPSDTDRQINAFIRAARLIAAASLPSCFAMATMADPLVRLLFEPRWFEAIPLIQIMCLGMTLRSMSWPIASLMKAQGRFRTHMFVVGGSILAFFPMTILGTWLGSALGLAVAIAIFYTGSTTVEFMVALKRPAQFVRDFGTVFFAPLVSSVLAAGIAWCVGYLLLPKTGFEGMLLHLLQCFAIAISGAVMYVLAIRQLSPKVWHEAIERAGKVLSKRQDSN